MKVKRRRLLWRRWRLQSVDDHDHIEGVVFVGGIACQNWVQRKWFSVPGQMPLANQSLLTSAANHYNFHPPSWPNPAPGGQWILIPNCLLFRPSVGLLHCHRQNTPSHPPLPLNIPTKQTKKLSSAHTASYFTLAHRVINPHLKFEAILRWAAVGKTDGGLYPKIVQESCGRLQLAVGLLQLASCIGFWSARQPTMNNSWQYANNNDTKTTTTKVAINVWDYDSQQSDSGCPDINSVNMFLILEYSESFMLNFPSWPLLKMSHFVTCP